MTRARSAAIWTLAIVATSSRARASDAKTACMAASERGQQERDDGKWKQARSEFSVCSRPACPAVIRRDCEHWLGDLEQAFPTVVVVARDAGGTDLTDVRVKVDGLSLTERLDGKPLEVDPGQHVFSYEVRGEASVEETLLVSAGEKNRVLHVPLPRRADAAPSAPTAAPALPPPPAPVDVMSRRAHTAWPFVIGGAGVAAMGGLAFFGATGLADDMALRNAPCARTRTCAPSQGAGVEARYRAADVSLGVGVVALGLATFLWVREARARPATGSWMLWRAGGLAFAITPMP